MSKQSAAKEHQNYRGRPKLGKERLDHVLVVRVSKSEIASIKAAAKLSGFTVSRWFRAILWRVLSKGGADK